MTVDDASRRAYAAEKAALQRLLELDGDARAHALAALQRDDPALAAKLARRVQYASDVPAEGPHDAPPSIPRYRLLDEIGRGGMGRVWRAQRADLADAQQLAIKQVRADVRGAGAGAAELLRRFDAERRILSRLDHPHIVPLLDAGLDAAGRPYIATAYVDGVAIDRWCDQHRVDVRGRVRLVRAVVDALAHAHRQLIVHRDLKPANVLVDAAGRVRLLDFGIAKLLDGEQEQTGAGGSLLTLRYAAPEQIAGAPPGTGCDLYAAGVLLYELLAGRTPYADLRDPAALTHAIVHVDPPLLPPRTPSGDSIPRDLAAIVALLLRKRPEQRYRSAEALADELDRWLAGLPVLAMADQRGYLARRWLRRRWPWVAAAGVLLALGALHTYRLDRELAATARERDKAQAVADYFVDLFRTTTPNAAKSGDVTARELLARGSERLGRDDGRSPQAVAALLLAVGRVHDDLGLQQEAVDLYRRAVERLEAGDDPLALAEAMRRLAGAYYEGGDIAQYIDYTQRAAQTLERAGMTSTLEYARLLANIGLGHLNRGEVEATWDHLDRSRARFHALRDRHPADYVHALVNSGGVAAVLGDYERARGFLLDAEREAALLRPRDRAQELFIARNLALVTLQAGDAAGAADRYAALVERSEEFFGAGHPQLVSALLGRAEAALANGRADAAEIDLQAAREHASMTLAPEHGQFTDMDGLLGIVRAVRGDHAAAIDVLQRTRARRGDEAIVEPQPRLEAVALARAQCDAAAMQAAFAALEQTRNMLPWQRALALRWRDECAASGG